MDEAMFGSPKTTMHDPGRFQGRRPEQGRVEGEWGQVPRNKRAGRVGGQRAGRGRSGQSVVRIGAIAALSVFVLVAGACSGGDGAKVAKPATTTTTTTPADCIISGPVGEAAPPSGGDQAGTESPDGPQAPESAVVTTTSILQKCLDDAFMSAVKDQGSKQLGKVPKDQVLAFGHGLCTYAQTVAADPAHMPTYSALVDSTSQSWGVKPAVFEEVLGFAVALCPEQLKPILDLKADAGGGAVELELSASSASPIDVNYMGPDGNELTNQVQTPWTQAIRLDHPTDYRFTAKASDADVACGVSVNGKVIKSAKADKGKAADCSVTTAEIRDANG